jgi:hypothetical protein
MGEQCANNSSDRSVGDRWERNFCKIAGSYGCLVSPMQIGRKKSVVSHYKEQDEWKGIIMPDIMIFTPDVEFHEIKHKNPSKKGYFGLEKYRFDSFMEFYKRTNKSVMYTIHNHDLNGGKHNEANKLEHWFTIPFSVLCEKEHIIELGASYFGGKPKEVEIMYWDANLWNPLEKWISFWDYP